MKLVSFLLGGLTAVLLLVGGVAYFLLSGISETGRQMPFTEGGVRGVKTENLKVKGRLEIPPSLAGKVKGAGVLGFQLVLGDIFRSVTLRFGENIENPSFPLEFELELPAEHVHAITNRRSVAAGAAQLRVVYCPAGGPPTCSWTQVPSLRARKILFPVTAPADLQAVLSDRKEINVGTISFETNFDRAESVRCAGGDNSIRGEVTFTPSALAKARGGAILFAVPVSAFLEESLTGVRPDLTKEVLVSQRLKVGADKTNFHLQGLNKSSGIHYFFLNACPQGQDAACREAFAKSVESRGFIGAQFEADYIGITFGGFKLPMCGDTGVSILSFTKEDAGNPDLPEEVRAKISLGPLAL
jgi:hypothetical protein